MFTCTASHLRACGQVTTPRCRDGVIPSTAQVTCRLHSSRLHQCAALGKPLFVGGAGIVADVSPSGGSTGSITVGTLAQRAGFFDAKLDASWSAGVGGYLAWEGIPEASDSAVNTNGGRYGIGSPLLADGGPDPVEAAFLEHAAGPPAGSCARPAVLARMDFEDGGPGWGPQSGPVTTSRSSAECFSGLAALAITVTGAGTARVRSSSDLGGLTARSSVTYRVFRPEGAPEAVRPYVVDGSGWSG